MINPIEDWIDNVKKISLFLHTPEKKKRNRKQEEKKIKLQDWPSKSNI